MKIQTAVAALIATAIAFPAFSGTASAAVYIKNKEKKTAVFTVKRANASMDVDIKGGSTQELPGATPMKITLKKTGEVIEANEGETIILEKGKLVRQAPVEETDGGTEGFDDKSSAEKGDSKAPDAAPEKAPETAPAPAPAPNP